MGYIASGDISINLSGGSTNTSSEASLGGEPSVYPISAERLFPDVSTDQTTSGFEDYRCVYVSNNSPDGTLYQAVLFTEYKADSDVIINLGFIEINERQTITISGINKITDGSFTIAYSDYEGGTSLEVDWDPDVSIWASNLQAALRSIERLKDVTVSASVSTNTVIFEINFVGYSQKRHHDLIQEVSNDLVLDSPQPSEGIISISRNVAGSPINSIAEEIDLPTTTPFGVSFQSYDSRSNSYQIEELRPGDVLPVWIRRTVPVNSRGLENDGVSIKIEGKALKQSI